MRTHLFYDAGFILASAEIKNYADGGTKTSLILPSVWGSLIQYAYYKQTVVIFCLLT